METQEKVAETNKKKTLVPLALTFAREVGATMQLETNACNGDRTTVSPDGCAWSDPS